jgi:hypothetical protein
MSKNFLLTLLVISLVSFGVFVTSQWSVPTGGIESKGGDPSLTVQYVSLATAVVSLMTAIVGLVGTSRKRSGGDT